VKGDLVEKLGEGRLCVLEYALKLRIGRAARRASDLAGVTVGNEEATLGKAENRGQSEPEPPQTGSHHRVCISGASQAAAGIAARAATRVLRAEADMA
jgi:hypothetical protein